MKQKMIIALIGIFSIAAFATFAEAGPGRRGDRGDRGNMHGKMMAELNLTDAQKNKLQSLRSTHQKQMVHLQSAVKIAQIELRDVLRQDSPKKDDVKARIAAANIAQNKMREARIMNRLESKEVFTPEQVKKMGGLRSQRAPERGMREGRRQQQRQFRGRRFHRQHGPGPMPGEFEFEPSAEEPSGKL
jgi:Spy/CpxP family protein refolding chaperone